MLTVEILQNLYEQSGASYTGVVYAQRDKTTYWFKNGNFHRDHGPATINDAGIKSWYNHGMLHRLDGPAVESTSSEINAYFIGGQEFTEENYYKHRDVSNEARQSYETRRDVLNKKIDVKRVFHIDVSNMNQKELEKTLLDMKQEFSNQKTKSEKTMGTENKVVDAAKSVIKSVGPVTREAAKRTMCRKLVKTTQETLVDFLTQGLTNEDAQKVRATLIKNLESERGKILVGGVTGSALPLLKNVVEEKHHKYVDEAAREFQVEALAVAGEMLADFVTGPMISSLTGKMSLIFDKMAEQDEAQGTTGVRADLSSPSENHEQVEEKQVVAKSRSASA